MNIDYKDMFKQLGVLAIIPIACLLPLMVWEKISLKFMKFSTENENESNL